MNSDSKEVRDLLQTPTGSKNEESVHERIRRRKVILREWLQSGIPQEALSALPTSLRQARDWDDQSLGISKIGSPNDFTTRHATWGQEVAEIARLLTQLRERYKQPSRRRRASSQTAIIESNTVESKQQLVQAVSQWHSARSSHLAEKSRADALESRILALSEEVRKKEAELSELRRQLTDASVGLRAVK
jgi:hypothetical protein